MIGNLPKAIALSLGFLVATHAFGSANDFPKAPIRLVVPYSPGGSADYTSRTVGRLLTEELGQPIVVENRTGAHTSIAASVARSAADGYTLFLGDTTILINSVLTPDASFDVFKDFRSIAMINSSPGVLVVWPGLPVHNYAELIAYAKANPNKLNFASAGVGTPMHIAGEIFVRGAGIQTVHVPYRGIGAAFTDLMSGRVQMAFSGLIGALPFTNDNRLRPIVTTGRKRTFVFPNIPTVAESGLKDYEVEIWFNVFAPSGIPDNVAQRLNSAINKVLASPEIKKAFEVSGSDIRITNLEESASFLREDYNRWRKAITEANIVKH